MPMDETDLVIIGTRMSCPSEISRKCCILCSLIVLMKNHPFFFIKYIDGMKTSITPRLVYKKYAIELKRIVL